MACTDAAAKVAVTDAVELSETVHVLAPEHAPDHPAKLDPLFGAAVNVTTVPAGKLALQLLDVQLIPGGLLVTVPLPEPFSETFN